MSGDDTIPLPGSGRQIDSGGLHFPDRSVPLPGYQGLQVYHGDLHSHCGVSYGHGSVEEAYQNARLQLDFASVTAHAHWHDIPPSESHLEGVVAYHQEGFRRAAQSWPDLEEATEAAHRPGEFVTFLSFEWHSMRHGDHNVYFRSARGEIIRAASLEEMRTHLRHLAGRGVECFLIPHHIGYLSGYRGIRWDDFTPEFSPVVEAYSTHGLAESDDGPFPYLIPMGPRDGQSTAQYGWRRGHVFGLIGSTDHHSAHPGSYGHGRVAVWAQELSRTGIWQAIALRRTYALTGDRILLAFAINGQPLGSILAPSSERRLEVSVVGGAALDYVEIIHNNHLLHRWHIDSGDDWLGREPVKVLVEFGWGPQGLPVRWQGELAVVAGRLLAVEPRFRGDDVAEPDSARKRHHAFSTWERIEENSLAFSTLTWGNPAPTTSSTQGLCLKIMGDQNTQIQAQINGRQVTVALGHLLSGSQVGYLGGFHSPAYCFHRPVHRAAYTCRQSLRHHSDVDTRDWYYVRVRQKNGQWAWSSPIWVAAP